MPETAAEDTAGTPFEQEEFEGGMIPTVSSNEAAAQAAAATLNDTDSSVPVSIGMRNAVAMSPEEASAIAAMRAEIEALRSELGAVRSEVKSGGGMEGVTDSTGGYPWMLWKFPPTWPDAATRGWLAVLPGGATPKGNRDAGSYSKYLRKGLIPVTKYGPAPIPTTTDGADVFRHFFRGPQGRAFAAEFPKSQVVAYRWHIAPPIAGLRFPQVEAIRGELQTFVCEACGYSMDFLPGDRSIGNVYRNHLMRVDKYPHREAVEAVKMQGFSTIQYAPRASEDALADSVAAS